jgi:tungstate transport system substrate-binding protein
MALVEALNEIVTKEVLFASRGDDSGTHKAELALWKKAGFDPKTSIPAWYVETGQGMGATLTIASEKEAYALSDRATYLSNKGNLQLDILVEGDPSLLNVYHVITVNPEKWDKVNYEGAMAFMKFMTQASTQERIGQFGVDTYGQPLFSPDAHKTDAELGL